MGDIMNLNRIRVYIEEDIAVLVGDIGWVDNIPFVSVERNETFWLVKSDDDRLIGQVRALPYYDENCGFALGQRRDGSNSPISLIDIPVISIAVD